MQGEVTRDSEGRGSPSEGEFGMGINDEKVFRAHGRRGFKVESEQRDSKLQVRASDPVMLEIIIVANYNFFYRNPSNFHNSITLALLLLAYN